jgi:phospholipase/carboxylesterase
LSIDDPDPPTGDSRLSIPAGTGGGSATLGLQRLGLENGRDGLLYVPKSYQRSTPLPLLVLFHGAGGDSSAWFGSYGGRAESLGMIVLAPDSRFSTWDAISEGFGRDVTFINRALERTFSLFAVDRNRLALAGFSDGASYSLSLGLANGDVFKRVIAYSPGFTVDSTRHGTPAFFVSHGKSDQVLPIDATSRRIVPALRGAGYTVEYTEFDGVHEVPLTISDAAMAWLKAAWA